MSTEIQDILNPKEQEDQHTDSCSYHQDKDTCNCGEFGKQRGRKAYQSIRDIARHELELSKTVTMEIIRDCPEHMKVELRQAFDKALQELS